MRAVVAGVVALGTFYFVYWLGSALLYGVGVPLSVSLIASTVAALAAAVGAGRLVWSRSRATAAPGLLRAMATAAVVTGGVAFCGGFFGPLLLTPDANQGPLLGIFITGPLGFLLGGIGGGVHWAIKRRRSAATD